MHDVAVCQRTLWQISLPRLKCQFVNHKKPAAEVPCHSCPMRCPCLSLSKVLRRVGIAFEMRVRRSKNSLTRVPRLTITSRSLHLARHTFLVPPPLVLGDDDRAQDYHPRDHEPLSCKQQATRTIIAVSTLQPQLRNQFPHFNSTLPLFSCKHVSTLTLPSFLGTEIVLPTVFAYATWLSRYFFLCILDTVAGSSPWVIHI